MRTLRILLLSFLLTVGSHAAAQKLFTLPSGKQLKVLGIVKVVFKNAPPALMLKYETDLSIDDMPDLEKEVDEIWTSFRLDVEKAQLTGAVISANERPSGVLVKGNRGYNFVFKRGANGKWSRT
jgi:hypothetical protein